MTDPFDDFEARFQDMKRRFDEHPALPWRELASGFEEKLREVRARYDERRSGSQQSFHSDARSLRESFDQLRAAFEARREGMRSAREELVDEATRVDEQHTSLPQGDVLRALGIPEAPPRDPSSK